MLGAILGDICGSPWEGGSCRDDSFELFAFGSTLTDDTVCTVAIAEALLHGLDIASTLRDWCRRYPGLGYGGQFNLWVHRRSMGPYGSWGNGAAMRASPCGWLADSLDEAQRLATLTAQVTHNSEEGLKGALAMASAIWYARHQYSADAIQARLSARFGYRLGLSVLERASVEPGGTDAAETVPIALDCGLQAVSVPDAIHRAVFIGGDSDTTASMAAALAEARLGLPDELAVATMAKLPPDMQAVVETFVVRTNNPFHDTASRHWHQKWRNL